MALTYTCPMTDYYLQPCSSLCNIAFIYIIFSALSSPLLLNLSVSQKFLNFLQDFNNEDIRILETQILASLDISDGEIKICHKYRGLSGWGSQCEIWIYSNPEFKSNTQTTSLICSRKSLVQLPSCTSFCIQLVCFLLVGFLFSWVYLSFSLFFVWLWINPQRVVVN